MDLTRIPKAELHRHLDLSLRHDTMRELAAQVGIPIPDDRAFAEHFLITEPMEDLGAVLNKFLNAQKLLAGPEVLERIAYEAMESAYREGIKIIELRYSPVFVQQGCPELSFEQIHQALLRGMERAEGDYPMAAGLICIVQRTLPLKEAEKVVDFAIAHKDQLIGLDLADDEEANPHLEGLSPLFLKAKGEGMHITVHSGESNIERAPRAPYYVRDAVELLGAERIGHGVQVQHAPEMMDYVRERGIPLELCPTSNWLTQAVPSKAQHPFRKLFDYGIRTTINSDDPGIFSIDLTHEYQLLADLHRFTEEEFHRCNDYAAAASFIPHSKKQAVWPRPIPSST